LSRLWRFQNNMVVESGYDLDYMTEGYIRWDLKTM